MCANTSFLSPICMMGLPVVLLLVTLLYTFVGSLIGLYSTHQSDGRPHVQVVGLVLGCAACIIGVALCFEINFILYGGCLIISGFQILLVRSILGALWKAEDKIDQHKFGPTELPRTL